jgi:tetratricopeptide (TPR) repeat protein
MLFSFDPSTSENRAEIEAHVAECARCSTTVDFMRVTDEDLGDEDVWEWSAGSASLRSFEAIAEQIAAEDAEADDLLKVFLSAPAATAWKQLHTRKKFLTGGVARRLSAEAHRVCEAEPLNALTFADAAISVVEALSDDVYPAKAVYELRGTAWKERANALRLLGRFDAALDSLKRAERAYHQLTSSALGMSRVAYVRATVLCDQQRLDEAAVLAEAAEQGFAHLGDNHRRMASIYLRAYINYEQHDLGVSISLYKEILDYGESLGDAGWIARAAYALGNCYVDQGNVGQASMHLHRALAIFREMAEPAHRARTEWGIARVFLAIGKYDEANSRLREAMAELEVRGMVTDAALAGLDRADALQVFMDYGMLTGALTAIAYLKETAAVGTLTAGDLQTVRKFLRRAERQPDLIFAPPPQTSP